MNRTLPLRLMLATHSHGYSLWPGNIRYLVSPVFLRQEHGYVEKKDIGP